MYNIIIRTNDRQKPTPVISCDDDNIHSVLAILERSPNVLEYKISIPEHGPYTNDLLTYYFSGYKNPAGKAVEQFNWDK